jgi:hypothetical protein
MDTHDQGAATVTLLRSLGPVLAKRWNSDGTISDYDQAARFTFHRTPLTGIADLHQLLAGLARDPRKCLIRGTPREYVDPGGYGTGPVRRNLLTFEDRPSHLFMVDVDDFPCFTADPITDPAGAVAEFVATLHEPLQRASYVWQLSGSAGHPSKPRELLRAHLWFWLAAPLTCVQAEAWTRGWIAEADATVHRTVQVNYTADPLLPDGMPDPCAQRLGVHHGVDAALDLALYSVPEIRSRTPGLARRQHVDPRAKLGVVGAVCRAFTPEQITELFPELFEAGRSPDRITWRAGGGSAEGLAVTDDGLHLFNSHNTAPTGGYSAHLFDFIRLHVFGHLDDGMDPEAGALDPTALPSYQATAAWARDLPEVREQLALDRPEVQATIIEARDANAAQAQEDLPGRAARLQRVLDAIEAAPDLDHLEHTVTRQGIARMLALFSDTDRERIEVALQQRTRALTGAKPISLKTIRKWLAHVEIDTSAMFADRDQSGQPLDTLDNFRALLGQRGITCRYNVITKAQEIALPDETPTPTTTSARSRLRCTRCAARPACRSRRTPCAVTWPSCATPTSTTRWPTGSSRRRGTAPITSASSPRPSPAATTSPPRCVTCTCASGSSRPWPAPARCVLSRRAGCWCCRASSTSARPAGWSACCAARCSRWCAPAITWTRTARTA